MQSDGRRLVRDPSYAAVGTLIGWPPSEPAFPSQRPSADRLYGRLQERTWLFECGGKRLTVSFLCCRRRVRRRPATVTIGCKRKSGRVLMRRCRRSLAFAIIVSFFHFGGVTFSVPIMFTSYKTELGSYLILAEQRQPLAPRFETEPAPFLLDSRSYTTCATLDMDHIAKSIMTYCSPAAKMNLSMCSKALKNIERDGSCWRNQLIDVSAVVLFCGRFSVCLADLRRRCHVDAWTGWIPRIFCLYRPSGVLLPVCVGGVRRSQLLSSLPPSNTFSHGWQYGTHFQCLEALSATSAARQSFAPDEF